jgi:hypothetical protein
MTDCELQFDIWRRLRSQGPHQTQIRPEKGTWLALVDVNVLLKLWRSQGDELVRNQLSNYLYGYRHYE